jgi:hypothetical protein
LIGREAAAVSEDDSDKDRRLWRVKVGIIESGERVGRFEDRSFEELEV